MIKYYERHSLGLDFLLPIVVGLVVIGVVLASGSREAVTEAVDDNRAAVYGALAGVAGSMLGFTLALIPILHAIVSMEGLRVLRTSSRLDELFRTVMHGVLVLGILTVASLAALVVDRDEDPVAAMQYLIYFLTMLSIWKVFVAVRLMQLVLNLALLAYRRETEEAA